MGFCLYEGKGTAKDQREAAVWFRRAAEQDVAVSQYNLALCYEKGNGVEKNRSEAIYWYTRAKENGYDKAEQKLRTLK